MTRVSGRLQQGSNVVRMATEKDASSHRRYETVSTEGHNRESQNSGYPWRGAGDMVREGNLGASRMLAPFYFLTCNSRQFTLELSVNLVV